MLVVQWTMMRTACYVSNWLHVLEHVMNLATTRELVLKDSLTLLKKKGTGLVFRFHFNFSLIFCHHVSHLTAHFQSSSHHFDKLPPPDYFPWCLVIPPFPLYQSLSDDPVSLHALVLAFHIHVFSVSLFFWSFYLAVTWTFDRLFGFVAFWTELSLDLSALPLVFVSGSDLISFWLIEHDNSVYLDLDIYIRNFERCLYFKIFVRFLKWTRGIDK